MSDFVHSNAGFTYYYGVPVHRAGVDLARLGSKDTEHDRRTVPRWTSFLVDRKLEHVFGEMNEFGFVAFGLHKDLMWPKEKAESGNSSANGRVMMISS